MNAIVLLPTHMVPARGGLTTLKAFQLLRPRKVQNPQIKGILLSGL